MTASNSPKCRTRAPFPGHFRSLTRFSGFRFKKFLLPGIGLPAQSWRIAKTIFNLSPISPVFADPNAQVTLLSSGAFKLSLFKTRKLLLFHFDLQSSVANKVAAGYHPEKVDISNWDLTTHTHTHTRSRTGCV